MMMLSGETRGTKCFPVSPLTAGLNLPRLAQWRERELLLLHSFPRFLSRPATHHHHRHLQLTDFKTFKSKLLCQFYTDLKDLFFKKFCKYSFLIVWKQNFELYVMCVEK